RAARTPDAQMAHMHPRFRFHHSRQHDIANAFQLRLVAEEEGFSDCDFIQQAAEFSARHGFIGEAIAACAFSTSNATSGCKPWGCAPCVTKIFLGEIPWTLSTPR